MVFQFVSEKSVPDFKINNPSDCIKHLEPFFNYEQEAFIVIILNASHFVKKVCLTSIGLVNRTVVHPREVFVEAVREMGAAIIVAHNHPSGNLDASAEDEEVSVRLKEAGNIIGIPVLDFLIFNSFGEYFSFLENGKI